MRIHTSPQDRWYRFITPQQLSLQRKDIQIILYTLSEIEFQAVLTLFRPNIRKILKLLRTEKAV